MGEVNNVGGIYLKIRKAEQKDIEALVSCRLDFLAEDSKKSLPEGLGRPIQPILQRVF